VEGAMTEIHAPLANSISHYFNLVTNCVAALEACTNQLIAKLLASGDIQEATIASWRPAGIANRPRHLLEWLNNPITDESETKQALEVFSQIVSIRNSFVHYKPMPVTFTYEKLSMADVVGDDNVNPEFCYVALKSISFLLDLLTQDKRKFRNTFHIARMGFSPGGWPSPYIDFHD